MSVLHNIQFAKLTDELGKTPFLSREQLASLQRTRLVQLVERARRDSRFYRDRFAGVPADFALADLRPTTKEEIRDHFDDVVTDPRLRLKDLQSFVEDESNLGKWYLGKYAVCHTSGTTGPPLMIVQDRRCMQIILASMAARGRPGKRPGLREAIRKIVQPSRVAAVAFRRGFYPSGITLEFTGEAVWPFARITRFSSIQPDLIERLNELQPHVISAYAGVLEGLAVQSERLKLKSLEYLTTSSERLSPRARKRIQEAFGVPVVDHYGTGECLQLADACRTCGDLHINGDWVILENVDDDYRPVPYGEYGTRVLITNLANTTQPFIRYEVSDRLALRAPDDSCPNHLPRIEKIEGRIAELFWIEDEGRERFLSGVLFASAADSFHFIREWRAIQRERNALDFEVQFLEGEAPPIEQMGPQLVSRLYEYGLPRCVSVNVVVADKIAPDPRTGKMRRMVSDLGGGPGGSTG